MKILPKNGATRFGHRMNGMIFHSARKCAVARLANVYAFSSLPPSDHPLGVVCLEKASRRGCVSVAVLSFRFKRLAEMQPSWYGGVRWYEKLWRLICIKLPFPSERIRFLRAIVCGMRWRCFRKRATRGKTSLGRVGGVEAETTAPAPYFPHDRRSVWFLFGQTRKLPVLRSSIAQSPGCLA